MSLSSGVSSMHTPTRLYAIDYHVSESGPMICTADKYIAQCYDVPTANRIVKCVNSHDELVAALREMALCFGDANDEASQLWWEEEHDRRGPAGGGMSADQIREAVRERARAALAKAGA